MFLWLVQHFGLLRDHLQSHTTGDSRIFLTGRTAAASVTSFLIAICFGPLAIRLLKKRFRERVASASERLNELHAEKNNTPTMGGLFVMGAILLSTSVWADLTNEYILTGACVVVALTTLGAIDDWVKMSTSRKGLTARQKLVAQVIIAFCAGIVVFQCNGQYQNGTDLIIPIGRMSLSLGAMFIVWSVIVLVGSTNAVNLTDGLDGLAAGCTIFAGSAFVGLTYLCGHHSLAEYLHIPHIPGSGELTIMMGSLVGAMLGFLWFNCYPAQIFMGDAGALPIGGLLGLAAIVTRQEILLVVVGGVFVIETLSVILQVTSFRLTGRRLLLCSPLHNHFSVPW